MGLGETLGNLGSKIADAGKKGVEKAIYKKLRRIITNNTKSFLHNRIGIKMEVLNSDIGDAMIRVFTPLLIMTGLDLGGRELLKKLPVVNEDKVQLLENFCSTSIEEMGGEVWEKVYSVVLEPFLGELVNALDAGEDEDLSISTDSSYTPKEEDIGVPDDDESIITIEVED